ncbi:Mobile element protein [methanotrophic endosymbiont of Bathymodiolus azoricus (Menez Gwen)]|nr:Mobile element protein [methanotrophic endosymbiont of Bathymodiolus azoricus (Menez Gwen)]
MDGRGRALDNIFVERLWRTVKYENIGSVARIAESEELLVFRHNYPAKAINCL